MNTVPTLHIDKLRSRFVSGQALDPTRVRQWHEAFAELDPSDLVDQLVRDEEWLLIRRLPLHARWGVHSAATEVGHVWWQALRSAVRDANAHPDARNVLRYRSRRHGLTDMLYRSAMGEVDRQWAWQRMGLMPEDGVSASEALERGLLALLDAPDEIWPVLHHLLLAEADTGAFTALVRRLPRAAWWQCLRVAPQSRAWMQVDGVITDPRPATRPAVAHDAVAVGASAAAPAIGGHAHADEAISQAPLGPMATLWWQWARSHVHLAQPLVDVWRVWLAALSWPEPGPMAVASQRLAAIGARVSSTLNAVIQPARASSRRPDERTVPPALQSPGTSTAQGDASVQAAEPMSIQQAAVDETGLPHAPALPEPDVLLRTEWVGVFFLLRSLQAPGVWEGLLQQAHLQAADPTDARALKQALLLALHVPLSDAIVPVILLDQPAREINPAVQAVANRQAAQWAQWLDKVMPDAPEPRLQWVCQRPGRIQLEPGWIEVHLDLDLVDTRLRRVGLDIDPGWVALLNAVVRICYE
jgi:hypothetical protein